MLTPSIIITMDYEISGDGSGDIQKLVIEPTERLLNILNARGIKMTVFFELEEFLFFRKYVNELKELFGYDPAVIIEEQLKKMVRTGHEIGLHIHTQWIGSSFNINGFNLFPKNLTLYDVFKSEEDIASYLKKRADILTAIIKKYDTSYKISCFRAGGLMLRPEKFTLKILQSLGIKAESSVVKGLHRIGEEVNLDYRNVPYNKGYWKINDNVCNEEPKGKIIEFPIYSIMEPEFKKLSINRIKQKFFSTNRPTNAIARGLSHMAIPKTPYGMIRYLFKKSPIKFDFCHMTSHEMLLFVNKAKKESGIRKKYPLTMIGHCKEFFNEKHFVTFLDSIIDNEIAEFITIGEAVKEIEGKEK
jgi:hypothetical protein